MPGTSLGLQPPSPTLREGDSKLADLLVTIFPRRDKKIGPGSGSIVPWHPEGVFNALRIGLAFKPPSPTLREVDSKRTGSTRFGCVF
jgi:hypothetical protein